MKTKERTIEFYQIPHNPSVCEHCCRLLVIPRNRLLEEIQEHIHSAKEVFYLIGKFIATLLMGVQFLLEAVFPHLTRQKTPYELEYERYQREWEEKREAEAKLDLDNRMRADANEESAYLNSLKTRFTHPKDAYFDAALVEQSNKLIDDLNQRSSPDPQLDRITLRKSAVEVEQLRLYENKQNERRRQLQAEHEYHIAEMERWDDRAYAASDSKEKRRCERESEVHKYKAYYAQLACENV